MKNYRIAISALIWFFSPLSMASTAEAEIQYLLKSVGQSECVFIRNGRSHSAMEAESHLRMKYGKTKSRIDSSKQFIERIASKSSWSGKPYFIECPDSERQRSRDWLTEMLAARPSKE
jgi:hypothetical protein